MERAQDLDRPIWVRNRCSDQRLLHGAATAAPLPAHARKELEAKIAECTRRRDAAGD